MNLQEAIRNSPRAIIMALFGWVLNVLITAILCNIILGMHLLNGILLGSIVGGGSSIIVIALARKIGTTQEIETTLCLESILTDVLCTVGTFTVIHILLSREMSLQFALGSVAIAFIVGLSIGTVIGIVWLFALQKLKSNAYMLTLAVLLLTFVLAKNLGGTGALSALFLGLTIGNGSFFSRIFKFEITDSIDENVRVFHNQISFLIRSFFFVFTGLLFRFSSINFILFGVFLAFVFFGTRFVVVRIATFSSKLKSENNLMTIMLPRGLAAAVLASLPLVEGIPDSQSFPEISFIIIITTIIMCTVGTAVLKKRRLSL